MFGRAQWHRALLAAALVSGLSARASDKTLAVAASTDCKDPELVGAMVVFHEAIKQRVGADALVDPQGLLNTYRPAPGRNLEDVQRLIDAAQTQFYSVQYAKADENVRQALAELERVPVTARPWKQATAAYTILGLIARAQNRKADADDAFRRILRVDPHFKLDPDFFTPSSRAHFQGIRRRMAQQKKRPLLVNSTPSGAEVYLDGNLVGKTPYKGNVVPGKYRLNVVKQDQVSFTQFVEPGGEEFLIDLEFEGSLKQQSPLCVTPGTENPWDNALKLAAYVKADQLVLFRVESRNAEPAWATATLFTVNDGTRVREGGLKPSSGKKSEGLAELASFVVTGRPSEAVVALGPNRAAVAAAPKPKEPARDVEPAAPAPAAPPTELPTMRADVASVATQSKETSTWMKPAAYVAMGAGAVAGGAAAFTYLSANGDRARLKSLLDNQGRLPPKGTAEYDEATKLRTGIEQAGALTAGLAVGGAAVAVGGVALLLMAPSNAEPGLSVGIAANDVGFAVSVRGHY